MATQNISKNPPKGKVKFSITLSEEQKMAKTNILYHPYNFVMGKAGSGKTLLAVQVALDMFFTRQINKIIITRPTVSNEDNGSVSKQLDKMLESSNVGPELISSLGTGLQSLSTNVGQMSELSTASVATTEYTNNVQKAAKTMEEITASSGAVNSSLNNFSGGLTNILSNLAETEGTTVNFKENLGKLNNNLSNLNTVYGNMLSAMGGTKA